MGVAAVKRAAANYNKSTNRWNRTPSGDSLACQQTQSRTGHPTVGL